MCKFEGMCEEYEQRIELVEKERDYLKVRLQEQEEEFKKLVNEKNMGEMEEGKFKNVLQEKIRKLEEERLQLVTQKNG